MLPIATFTRPTPAYLSDGTQVAANQPRFEAGKFGKAIMVEEGTENIQTWTNPSIYIYAGSLDVSEIVTGGLFNNTTFHMKSTAGCDCAIWNNGLSTDQGWYSITGGATYTFSVYVKAISLQKINALYYGAFHIRFFDSTGALITPPTPIASSNPTTIYSNVLIMEVPNGDTNGQWIRVWITVTAPSSAVKCMATIGLGIYGQATGELWATGFQLEQKPYATSFIDGTRSPETLTIPTAGVLNPQEGTVECWVYIDDRFINGMAGKCAWIWGTKGSPYYPILNLYRDGATNTLRFVSRDANNNQSYIEKSLSQISVGWHYIACTWKSSRLAFLLDGQLVGEVVSPYLPNAVDAQMYIGHNPSVNEQCDSLIDDLRISNRARSDAEILAAYQSGQPLQRDERTTYKADFDEKIRGW